MTESASRWAAAAAKGIRSIKSSREIWAWAFYDFANSPFSTTITTVVFNVYFAQVVAQGAPVYGDALWGILVAAATLISGICSPVLGAAADQRALKKKFLAFFAVLGAVSTGLLIAARPETLALSCLLFITASVSFSVSFTFYNAFLNDLSDSSSYGRLSGLGWALGYLGGGLCLALNLAMIQRPQWFNLPAHDHWPVRFTFLVVGIWWLIFSLPILLWVKERPVQRPVSREPILKAAFGSVWGTLKEASGKHRNLFRFIIAYLLYNDGIETVIVMASLFAAQVIGMDQGEIISCFLMIQFVAFIGALICGKLGDWLGNKKSLQAVLVLWSLALFWALFMKSKTEFWMSGVVIALVLGGAQSLSRSLFAGLIPKGMESQCYGFLNLSSKISATLGPLTYAVSRQITGSPRWAILSMLVFFILGQIILLGVRAHDENPELKAGLANA